MQILLLKFYAPEYIYLIKRCWWEKEWTSGQLYCFFLKLFSADRAFHMSKYIFIIWVKNKNKTQNKLETGKLKLITIVQGTNLN